MSRVCGLHVVAIRQHGVPVFNTIGIVDVSAFAGAIRGENPRLRPQTTKRNGFGAAVALHRPWQSAERTPITKGR